MSENMKRTVKDADSISGEGFAGGHGHMDVAVVYGKDPDIEQYRQGSYPRKYRR